MCHVRGWGGTKGADVNGPEAQARRGRLVPRAQAVPPFPDLARTSDPGRSLIVNYPHSLYTRNVVKSYFRRSFPINQLTKILSWRK